jgi:hypothetical protein
MTTVVSFNQTSYPVLEEQVVEVEVEKVESLAKRIFSNIASGLYACKDFAFSLLSSIKSKITHLFFHIIFGKSENLTKSSNQEDEKLVAADSILANAVSNRASTALVAAVVGQCLMPQSFFLRQVLLAGAMILEEIYPNLTGDIKQSIGGCISHSIDLLKTNFLHYLPIARSFLNLSFCINPFEVDAQNVAKKMALFPNSDLSQFFDFYHRNFI